MNYITENPIWSPVSWDTITGSTAFFPWSIRCGGRVARCGACCSCFCRRPRATLCRSRSSTAAAQGSPFWLEKRPGKMGRFHGFVWFYVVLYCFILVYMFFWWFYMLLFGFTLFFIWFYLVFYDDWTWLNTMIEVHFELVECWLKLRLTWFKMIHDGFELFWPAQSDLYTQNEGCHNQHIALERILRSFHYETSNTKSLSDCMILLAYLQHMGMWTSFRPIKSGL